MPHRRSLPLLAVVAFAVLAGATPAAALGDGDAGDAGGSLAEQGSPPATNASIERLARAVSRSALGDTVAGKTTNVYLEDESAAFTVRFGSGGGVRVDRGASSARAFDVRMETATLRSVATAGAPSAALEKAVAYGLITIRGHGARNRAAASAARRAASLRGQSSAASTRVDVDDDGRTDAVLDVEGRGGEEFESVTRTVLRDVDGDGELETVSSDRRRVHPSLAGVAELDTDDDGATEARVRVDGTDTGGDGVLDRRRTTSLTDTDGDGEFDAYAERVESMRSAASVTGEWDLTDDGVVDVRIAVEGHDGDGDGRFERKTTAVFLNLDGEPGFETVSNRTSRTTRALSISATFDTDDDGQADRKASFRAEDSNGDGTLDTEETSVLGDDDGDGEFDAVLKRGGFHRGFLTNDGSGIAFLDDPRSITIVGVVASVLSMLLQLFQGG